MKTVHLIIVIPTMEIALNKDTQSTGKVMIVELVSLIRLDVQSLNICIITERLID